jgi:hypothetical protein
MAFNYFKSQCGDVVGAAVLFYDDAALLYSSERLNLQVRFPHRFTFFLLYLHLL